jgi:hypothetical protein
VSPTNDDVEDVLILDQALGSRTPFERLAVYFKYAADYTDRQVGELLFASDPTVLPGCYRDRGRDLTRAIVKDLRKSVAA